MMASMVQIRVAAGLGRAPVEDAFSEKNRDRLLVVANFPSISEKVPLISILSASSVFA